MTKMHKAVIGRWRISDMEMWDADYFGMDVPAHIPMRVNPTTLSC